MPTLLQLQRKHDTLNRKKADIDDKISEVKNQEADIAKDILLKAIITGTRFKIRHGSVAPYSTGYMIVSNDVTDNYCKSVTYCSDKWWYIVNNLYEYLTSQKNWTAKEFIELEKDTKKSIKNLPVKYNPDRYGPDNSLHGHHIADGYERDGFKNIVLGHCHGTWSSSTTCAQNDLAVALCILRGFGTDYYLAHKNRNRSLAIIPIGLIEYVYRSFGILNADEHLDNNWLDANPDRCVMD